MTTKTISTYISGGYFLAAKYDELDITATGGVGGGVYSNHFATISNAGKIVGIVFPRIYLPAGGVVENLRGGSIEGASFGVSIGGGQGIARVTNNGTIRATGTGILLAEGGAVVNGGYTNLGALIEGDGRAILVDSSPGTVNNFATITSDVVLRYGGSVINGGAGDTTALIGGGGVNLYGAFSTVTNFGAIHGLAGAGSFGVTLGAGGTVTNGGLTDTVARIDGAIGVEITGAATVANFGVIAGTRGAAGGYGVLLNSGGRVTNGAPSDRGALIEGYEGVAIKSGAGTVTNFGTVIGQGAYNRGGVVLYAGGSVTNGSNLDRTALIEGAAGVFSEGAAGTISNFGTIRGTGAYGGGVVLFAGGSLTNGSATDGAALIEGDAGVTLLGACAATNFGTISGLGVPDGTGVYLHSGSTLTNGASGHAGALIQGYLGVRVSGTGTVTNFGTIRGMGAPAVYFASYTDVLIVEAGCAFEGAVLGGGGTLDLDTGTGTLTGLLAGGNVTVSGSMAATTFSDFGTVEIGAAASFASSGAVTIAAGQTVNDAGVLTLGGATASVTNAGLIETAGSGVLTIQGALDNSGALKTLGGNLVVKGAVTGAGKVTIGGGAIDFAADFGQGVTFTGTTGILELGQSQSYKGTIAGFSKIGGTFLDLDDIAFGGATMATYSGTKRKGVLTVTDGAHTAMINFKGDYRSSTFVVASDGHGGTVIHDPSAPTPTALPWVAGGLSQRFIAAMAGLGSSAGATVHTSEPWVGGGAMLSKPRAMIA